MKDLQFICINASSAMKGHLLVRMGSYSKIEWLFLCLHRSLQPSLVVLPGEKTRMRVLVDKRNLARYSVRSKLYSDESARIAATMAVRNSGVSFSERQNRYATTML